MPTSFTMPKLEFEICKDASWSEFLQPYAYLITMTNIETLVDYFKFNFSYGYTHIINKIMPELIAAKITNELGIDKFYIKPGINVFQKNTSCLVRFYNPEEYLLFKIAYA